MEIEKWFNSEVLPKFDGQDIEYMRAYHTLPKLGDALKVALEVANYAYKRGFSAFIGHDKSASAVFLVYAAFVFVSLMR